MKLGRRTLSITLTAIERNLRSGSSLLFTGFMLGNVVAYLYQMVLSRLLSPADYGALVTLTSAFYVLAVFWRAAQAWVIDAVAGTGGVAATSPGVVFRSAMRTLVPLGGVLLAIHWLGSGPASRFLHLTSAAPIVLLGFYVSSTFLMPIAIGLPIGLNRFYLASGVLILEAIVRLVAGVALVVLGFGVSGALGGFVVGNVATFAATMVILWPLLATRGPAEPSGSRLGGLDRYSLLALLTNATLMALISIDQVVVKHYFSPEVAGNYAVAFLLGRIISVSTMSLAWVIFARSATMALNDPRRTGLLIKGLLVSAAIAGAFTAGYLVAPGLAVRMLGGSHYVTADRYVGLEGVEMILFSLVYVQAYYHISVRRMHVLWPLGVATLLEVGLLLQYHASIQEVLLVLNLVMGGLLLSVSVLTWRLLRETSLLADVAAARSAQTVL